jgi:hypothetical protein
MAKATHRLIFQGSREQDRTYHMSQVFAAVRALDLLLKSLKPRTPGVYEACPAAVLHARHKLEAAAPYLSDERPSR